LLVYDTFVIRLLKSCPVDIKDKILADYNSLTLDKFADEPDDRLQILLYQNKANPLTSQETLDLAATAELDEIFSYANAVNASL
jgi:hypothetical protein